MDMIWNAIQHSPVLDLVLVAIGIFIVSRLTSHRYSDVRPGDTVPQHKRFERREMERGDRRHDRAMPFTGLERRTGLRRIAS